MDDRRIIEICSNYSMISRERLMANINAVRDVQRKQIPGCIVECGVWKGGSLLSMILAAENEPSLQMREFHAYDTFEGMTPPTHLDKDLNGYDAHTLLAKDPFIRCISHLDEVQRNISSHTSIVPNYHVGDIVKTIEVPSPIAVLRLDTDWYESTKFELETFYPHVSPGGYVIIDDYGHWKGCKQAVDEFLALNPGITLTTIDYTGRYFIKPRTA
jgi:hypothetical protein